ncbi:DUF6966 domain-containing protein [Hafnia alvei]|uniref:DUF6966 domain-containing protein n=1 Tax=Hafnia alvei TaxID=569 RepID=UPI0024A9A111|nr:hypothetical protein [Hafnia alvei]
MTINKTQSVKEKMERMAALLALGGYQDWSSSIFNLAKKYESDPDFTRHSLLGFYGGMGSLNDLVLYRDGKVLINENEELEQLKSDLFNILS